jgi:hypothetical protein
MTCNGNHNTTIYVDISSIYGTVRNCGKWDFKNYVNKVILPFYNII